MKAVRLIGLTACLGALAACNESPTTPIDPHLAMTQESRAEADRLYNLATSSGESANTYRPLLLKAVVDGLQWGVEMDTITVDIGGTPTTLRAMAMDNIITNPSSSGGFMMLWSTDNNVNTIIVVSKPYGAGAGSGFNELGFYLTGGGDTPYIAKARPSGDPGSASFTMGNPGASCTYENETPLVGPAAEECKDQDVTPDFDLSFYPNGDTSQGGVSISTPGPRLFVGVRVVRDATLFPSSARVLPLAQGM